MPSFAPAHTSVYVARQPILDAGGGVFGYELLYRAAAGEASCQGPLDLASARVVTDALLTVGLGTLTGGRRAFLNVTRNVLLTDLAALLPRDGVVIEILESIRVDDEVIAACERLRTAGYTIALDDYVPGTACDALLPYAGIVKVDVLDSRIDPARIAASLPPRMRLVAEKVESHDVFAEAVRAGFHLFQGYYFARPSTLEAKALTGRRGAPAMLLANLHAPNATVGSIEDVIKRDGELTYRILRCINSAAFAVRQQVTSIRQALVLLGLDQVRKWASVWALAGMGRGSHPELIRLATIRARTCELLAATAVGDASSEYFLLGLCSLLDAMLGTSMDTAIQDLPISDDVRRALLGDGNRPRFILDGVIAWERGEWDTAVAALRRAGVTADRLPDAYADALGWANTMTEAAAA